MNLGPSATGLSEGKETLTDEPWTSSTLLYEGMDTYIPDEHLPPTDR